LRRNSEVGKFQRRVADVCPAPSAVALVGFCRVLCTKVVGVMAF